MDPNTLPQHVGEQSAHTSWAQQTSFKVTVTHSADFPSPSVPLHTTQSNNRKCSPAYNNNSRPPIEQMPNADHQLDDFSPDAEQHEQTSWDQIETWNDMNQSSLGQDIKHEPNQFSPDAVTKPVQTAQQPNHLRPDVKHWSKNQLRPDISHWMNDMKHASSAGRDVEHEPKQFRPETERHTPNQFKPVIICGVIQATTSWDQIPNTEWH